MKNFPVLFFLIFIVTTGHAQLTNPQHPEKGILPFNAPCKDCTEEIEKRSANSREFFMLNGDGSKTIYKQQSLGNMNFKDADGFWRTKDPRVVKENENVYAARMQPSPVVIDFQNRFASITGNGKELRFNKNISLVHIAADGSETSLGEGNWNNMTRSENYSETIFLLKDFYPGIDLQMIANAGRVETNFILNNKLQLNGGWLVMRQEVAIPDGLKADFSQSELAGGNKHAGAFAITGNNGTEFFSFRKSFVHDANTSDEKYAEMPFVMNTSTLDYFVDVNWLNQVSLQYPVTLDPLVQSSDTLVITGSGYTAVCGTQGCSYFINNLMTPPDCEITAINVYFSYLANLPCVRDDGGFDITMTSSIGSCTSRNFTCLGGIQGDCFFWPAQLLNAVPPLFPCLLPAQCASYPLSFEMKFRRCNWIPIVPCDASCITANSDLILTIEGRTTDITGISSVQTICNGDCANLLVSTAGGLPPYTITWNPGGLTGNPITVCPTSDTHYSAYVTDSCGMTSDTLETDVVVLNCNGIHEMVDPVSSVYPNPANGKVTLKFSGHGGTKNLQLLNLLGEMVLDKMNIKDDELILDLSSLPKGIYFAKVSKENMTGNHKIILY